MLMYLQVYTRSLHTYVLMREGSNCSDKCPLNGAVFMLYGKEKRLPLGRALRLGSKEHAF